MKLTDEQFTELKARTDISFITLTNYGFIDYAKNLILSLDKCKFPLSLKIYCIDQKSFDELTRWNKNIIVEMLDDETNTNETIVGWKEPGWNTMVFSKIKCMYKELLNNSYVFFSDSDIVIDNNYSIQYLIDSLKDYDMCDMCIQQNTQESKYPLNSGFIFMKSNEKMKNLFDWRKIDIEKFTCDQDYINDNKDKFNYYALPRNLFPIEKDYYQLWLKPGPFNPYIIHFNYNVGKKKEIRIKKLNKWFLD